MDERDKVRLQLNSRTIIDNLDPQDILDHLYTKRVLSQKDVETLMVEEPARSAARRLVVSLLPRKGRTAFALFCEALREAEYEYLAEQLEATQVTDEDLRASEAPPRKASCADSESDTSAARDTPQSREFQEELNELRQIVKQAKSRREVDDLQYENFMLKKQLSFYEERADGRGRRSVSSSNFEQATSKGFEPAHHKRNSFSGFTATWPENTGAKASHSRTTSSPIATIFDRECDDVMGVALDDLDSAQLSFRLEAYFDDIVDGLSPREAPDRSQESHRSFVSGVTSSSEPKMSEADTKTLSYVLVRDVIVHFQTNPGPELDVQTSEFKHYCDVMRRAVESMTRKHGPILEQISRDVDLTLTWQLCTQQLTSLCLRFLEEDFRHACLFWGRTVAIFALFCFIANKLRKLEKDMSQLTDFCSSFVTEHLHAKIMQIGGWVREFVTTTCIFL